MKKLQWRKWTKRAYGAPDGKGGWYHVERPMLAWLAVYVAPNHATRRVELPMGVKATLEVAQAACEAEANRGKTA